MRRLGPALCFVTLAACGGDAAGPMNPMPDAAVPEPPPGPIATMTNEERAAFVEGDRLFELPLREADGLGPLYIRNACAACHRADGRGPGLVAKLAVVEADGWTPSTDQTSALPYGPTERPFATAGATKPIIAPDGVRRTFRLPPAVFGRGYLEAIDDAEIERLEAAAQARSNGIRGRIHRVGVARLIGRFGLKGRVATLDEFTADAFQGDMGITSPLRPTELPNPEGVTDDAHAGVDVSLEVVDAIAAYMRLLAIPPRPPAAPSGRAAFEAALCSSCHVPALRTRADYPIAALAGIDAPVYTDLLLHDMGEALADGVVDGNAGSREWKTAPLIGIRHATGFLHDGRARTVADAIALHEGAGSEANASIAAYRALDAEARAALVQFVEGL